MSSDEYTVGSKNSASSLLEVVVVVEAEALMMSSLETKDISLMLL